MILIKELREAYTRADQKRNDARNRKIQMAKIDSQPKIKSGPVSKAHQAVAKTSAEWDKIRKQTQAGNEKLLMKRMTPAQKKAYIKNKKNKDWEFDYAMAQIGIDTGARIESNFLERIVKEYTQPINEARAKKWTDDDKFWSKNITGKIAAKGSGKYDITEIWGRGPYPTKKYQDGKADDDGQGGKTRDNFGDQNMKQHAFWKKRYDIEITGQHFDALAKNGKGAVVPLLYNRGGISRDTVLSKGALDKDYESYFSKISYVDLNKSKHKVFISGENQDIYDWFVSPEWTKDNKTPSKMLKDILGVESWRDTMIKDNPKALKSLEIDKSENGDFWDEKEMEYIYRSNMNRQQLKALDTRMKKQGFVWDKEAGRYPKRSNGGYVDRKGKRLDFDNFKI